MNLLENNNVPVGHDDPNPEKGKITKSPGSQALSRKQAIKQERVKKLYMRQLEGLPAKQLVLDHAKKEQVSEETAWRDWREVAKLNDQDFSLERETMAARIFAMRQKVLNAALRRGQMQTAASVLDSLARQVGCDEAQVSQILPEIRVRVENPEDAPITGTPQPPMIDVTDLEDGTNG